MRSAPRDTCWDWMHAKRNPLWWRTVAGAQRSPGRLEAHARRTHMVFPSRITLAATRRVPLMAYCSPFIRRLA